MKNWTRLIWRLYDLWNPILVFSAKWWLNLLRSAFIIYHDSHEPLLCCSKRRTNANKNNRETRESSFCWLDISSILNAKTPPLCPCYCYYSLFIIIHMNHYDVAVHGVQISISIRGKHGAVFADYALVVFWMQKLPPPLVIHYLSWFTWTIIM